MHPAGVYASWGVAASPFSHMHGAGSQQLQLRCQKVASSPKDAVATPTPTTTMLAAYRGENFSVPSMMPTTNTVMGMVACAAGQSSRGGT
jgi:hypothetical protein